MTPLSEVPSELSVWEIAHRWYGVEISASGVPAFQVRDTLRWICDAIDGERLFAVDYRRDKLLVQDISTALPEISTSLPTFLREIRGGTFNRELLDAVFVWNQNFAKFCQDEGILPPAFWFGSGGSISPSDDKPLSDVREDRISCRAIAQVLWKQDPLLTIVDIEKHEWIKMFGNSGQYKGKATIRNWIKDLNPKPPDQRHGRPRNPKK